ncbi:MAG: hypothetical protein V7603_1022 [Micromonosporaceae bacterium]
MRAIISGIVLSGLLLTGATPAKAPLARDLTVAKWRTDVAAIAPGVAAPDPATASPAQVAGFFTGLSAGQRETLARRDPALVGNLDGVPVALRYEANERVVPEVSRIPGRLLGYDPRGDGRAIVVLGDLATARHIAVLVPGMGWGATNLLGAAGQAGNHPLAAARAVFDEAHRLDPRAPVAVLVWLGYDPPQGLDPLVARSERAEAGAPALRRFLEALPEESVTLLCHSYGAVVCGRAAQGMRAGDLVALAAPGLDVSTVDELRTAARVWAARTPDDPIRFAPHVRVAGFGHGADPVAPGFGARVLRTGTARGHEGYYAPGTESLTNLARIVLGLTAEVSRADSV